MSVQQITLALSLRNVSQAEKLLLIVLANYADEDGRCWPSQKRLGEDAGMSDRSVRTAFVKLEEAGLIVRERRNRRDGSRGTDMIELHLERANDQRKNLPAEKSSSGKSCTDYRKNLHELPENISGLTTFEPTIEPSIEPSEKRAGEIDAAFDRFWAAYPSKLDKVYARKVFPKALKKTSLDRMLMAIDHARQHSPAWRDNVFLHPSTWLNKERWNDEFRTQEPFSAKGRQRLDNFGRAFAGASAAFDPPDDYR
jgi:hypothetical protein